MRIDTVSIFPEMFSALQSGVVGRAIQAQLLQLQNWNPRDYSEDAHATVDDRPYGGGPGMVMMAQPLCAAIRDAKAQQQGSYKTIYMNPQGRRLSQQTVNRLAQCDGLILLAGRYEGIDERLIELEIDEEWSIGDYVISGGELAIMVLIDALARQHDGVLGEQESAKQDSFMHGLLDCPHYTRPADFEGLQVPEVLLSGNHQAIEHWRLEQSLIRTLRRRPDLFKQYILNDQEQAIIDDYLAKQDNHPENEARK